MRLSLTSVFIHGLLASAATLDILDGIRTRFNLPALAAGVINPNRTIQAQAAGFRKYGTPINATAYDQYHIGSNTKAMTAVLIAKYIEDGKFSWNSTLEQVLPEWRERMKPPYRNVTLAQLASHHSGFTDAAALKWVQDSGINPNQSAAAQNNASAVEGRLLFVQDAFNVTPTSPPDEFSYSNQNYVILGFIVDTLFGPWEDQLEEKMWRPLNMTECGFGNFPEPNSTAVEGIWPHAPGNPNPIPLPPTWETENPRLLGPAGTGRCSPRSYAKFLALHLDGASGRNTSILRASSFPSLHTPYRVNSGRNYTSGGWSAFYSPNPQIGTYLGHDGSNTWNYASAAVLIRLNTAIFGFTNVAGPNPDTSDGQKGVSAALQQILNNTLVGLPIIENGTANSSGSGLAGIGNSSSKNAAAQVGIGSPFAITVLILVLFFIFVT